MNPFESLCKLASKEGWCWKLCCTTCGHLHFRYAFLALANGKSPEDTEWLIHSKKTSYEEPFPREYTEKQKEIILRICSSANLLNISRNRFPDWLGYLGLVLEDMKSDSNAYKELSVNWAKQLQKLVPEHSHISERLESITSNDTDMLNIKDLEACETYILR